MLFRSTISFTSAAPANATVGGATYSVAATATSGLTVSFTTGAPSVCTVTGSTVSFIGAGSCIINANQPCGAGVNPAPQVQQSFSVGQGTQAITFTSVAPVSAVVGGASYTVGATSTSGLAVSFTSGAPGIC